MGLGKATRSLNVFSQLLSVSKYAVKGKFNTASKNILPNGVLYLKGGDLTREIAESGLAVQQFHLKDFFEEEFFETKQVVYIKEE